MSGDEGRQSLRPRVASAVLCAGILTMVYAVLHAVTEVEGAKQAGGAMQYLGVARWQEHGPFVLWAFSFPLSTALVLMAALLRNRAIPGKLAVGLPIGFLVGCVFLGLVLTFPVVVPGFFGLGGSIMATGFLIAIYLSGMKIRPEDPWPGLLRSLGYLTFAFAAVWTCGVFSTPGGLLLPGAPTDQAAITDLAHKLQLSWVIGWVSTALGFVFERRPRRNPQIS